MSLSGKWFRPAAFFLLLPLVFSVSSCQSHIGLSEPDKISVGFDIDDTLLFSTPAFQKGFASGNEPFSPQFWEIVNSSDRENSLVKKKTLSILEQYRDEGANICLITARKTYGADKLKSYLSDLLNIPKENIYFEPRGKMNRIKFLDIKIFFGDSDSDIEEAIAAGAIPYRIERSTASSYRKNYNPGMFGETIIGDSEW